MEELNIKYVKVEKMKCYNKEISIPYGYIETIIEACRDYAVIIEDNIDNVNGAYKKATCNYKINQLNKIADELISKTGYCKECGKNKFVDDVGMDSFEIMGNRNRQKKEVI